MCGMARRRSVPLEPEGESISADLLEAGYAALAVELGLRGDAEQSDAETHEGRRRLSDGSAQAIDDT